MKKLILFLFLISGYLLHSQDKTFYGNITVKDVPTFAVTDSLLTIDSNGLFKYRPISTLPFGSGGGSELSFTYPLTETNDTISFNGSNYKQWSEVVTLGEDVAQGKIIVSRIDGKWYKASANDIGIGGNRLLVTYVAALTDEQVQANSAISLPCISCTYTSGDRLYLSETAGEFTTIAPTTGMVRLVGTVSPDTKGWFAEDVFYHVEPTFHSVKADGTEVDGIPLLGDIDLNANVFNDEMIVLIDTVPTNSVIVSSNPSFMGVYFDTTAPKGKQIKLVNSQCNLFQTFTNGFEHFLVNGIYESQLELPLGAEYSMTKINDSIWNVSKSFTDNQLTYYAHRIDYNYATYDSGLSYTYEASHGDFMHYKYANTEMLMHYLRTVINENDPYYVHSDAWYCEYSSITPMMFGTYTGNKWNLGDDVKYVYVPPNELIKISYIDSTFFIEGNYIRNDIVRNPQFYNDFGWILESGSTWSISNGVLNGVNTTGWAGNSCLVSYDSANKYWKMEIDVIVESGSIDIGSFNGVPFNVSETGHHIFIVLSTDDDFKIVGNNFTGKIDNFYGEVMWDF